MMNLPQCSLGLDEKKFWTIYFKTYYASHVMETWDASDKWIPQKLIKSDQ